MNREWKKGDPVYVLLPNGEMKFLGRVRRVKPDGYLAVGKYEVSPRVAFHTPEAARKLEEIK